jgi:flagellar biosynthesis regulator FlaF
MDNTDAHLEQADATVVFCIFPAQHVWRTKINDRKTTNNELKEEDRSVLTFWKNF